jgi:hypothetical protein
MNNNTFEAVKQSLRFPIRARYIKVYPLQFIGAVPCLTLEVYGKEGMYLLCEQKFWDRIIFK